MAVGTATAITAGIGLVTSGAQAISSSKDKKNAQNELNNYERQELVNAHKERQISTIGSDLMREESSRTTANLVNAARGGGIRGIFGALPKIQSYNNSANAQAQNYLDNQVIGRSRDIANAEMQIQGFKENRDNQNISALGSQIDSANQNMWSGITGVANSAAYLAKNAEFDDEEGGEETV